jgi:hypothetical protein
MGWSFKRILKAAVSGGLSENTKTAKKVVSDVGKTIAALSVMPVNSVTGHVFNPKLETTFGKVVGGALIVGNKGLNVAAKTFADAVSGGYASKAVNLIRSKNNQESTGHYSEGVINTSISPAFQRVTFGVGQVIGTIYGSKAAAGKGEAGAAAKTASEVKAVTDTTKEAMNFSSILSGANNFVSSPLGQLASQLVVNAAAPKPAQNTAAQNAAFNTGQVGAIVPNNLTPAAAAALGQYVSNTSTTNPYAVPVNPWYKNPVILGIAGVIGTLVTIIFLMRKKRR